MVHPLCPAAETGENRGMDEAGRGKRRPDDASFRNDDLLLDVHHAALAAARSVGARARADGLEPERGVGPRAPRLSAAPAPPPTPTDSIRVLCTKCQAAMRVPLAVLRGKSSLNVRCPQCKTVITLRPKPAAPPPAPAGAETKSAA